jgi:uncharacterized membrane protein YozB (DUF420 family)
MLELTQLPTLNAVLNSASALCLLAGVWLVRRGRWRAHRGAMLAAVTFSVLFLASYLVYHFQVGSVRYQGVGGLRALYFTILVSHTVLATFVPFIVGLTLWLALRGRIGRHRRLARWTYPVWLYVSVTGVVIYLMLYTFPP